MAWRLLVFLLLLLPAAAPGVPIQVSFTAGGFVALSSGSPPPPQDPVSGTVVYEAASISAPIDSLRSISLTIDGFTYALADVGFENGFIVPTDRGIGGLETGVRATRSGTNDFVFRFDADTLEPTIPFVYTSVSAAPFGTYDGRYSEFSVTVVPEPTGLALLGLGLVGLGAHRRARGVRLRSRASGTPPRPAPAARSAR